MLEGGEGGILRVLRHMFFVTWIHLHVIKISAISALPVLK